MVSLKTSELQFLLRLLGCKGYRGKVSELSPNSKTSAAERDRICTSLAAKGLIECSRSIARFTLSSAGRTLLSLDTKRLLVTPDELKVLRACKGSMTPGQLGAKMAGCDRQKLISGLANRRMLKITKTATKEVWLSAKGKRFLLHEYEPSGHSVAITPTMLGYYLNFLRQSLSTNCDDSPDGRT